MIVKYCSFFLILVLKFRPCFEDNIFSTIFQCWFKKVSVFFRFTELSFRKKSATTSIYEWLLRCKLSRSNQHCKVLLAFAIALEMIYFIRNFDLVLPHRFLVNILQYFVSGSKTVSALNGRVTREASYSAYKKWVNDNGKKALKCPKDDQVTFFDNIGKYVLKNYSMSSQKNVRPDIVKQRSR